MSSRAKTFLAAFLVLGLVAAGVLLTVFAPKIVKSAMVEAVKRNCETCHLEIARLQVPVLSFGTVIAEGLHFTGGTTDALEFDLKIARVEATISILQLAKKIVDLGSLEISEPHLKIAIGDAKSPKVEADDKPSSYKLRIGETRVSGGSFKYTQVTHGKQATLDMAKIAGSIQEFGTTDKLQEKIVESTVEGQLEQSGSMTMKTAARYFHKPLVADVKIEVKNQDLSDLTPFFKNNDGISLKGTLLNGTSTVVVRGKNLTSTVKAEYKGLDVQVDKTKERSGAAAFFMNVAAEAALKDKNTDSKPADKVQSVNIERRENESVLRFILRGIKDATFKVPTA